MSPNDGRFVDRSEFDYQQQIRMLRGQDPLLPMTAVIFEDSHSSYSGWRIRWRPEDRWIERLDFFAVYNDDHQSSNGNENINDLLAVSTPTHCDETVQTLHHGHPSRPWRRITAHLASVEPSYGHVWPYRESCDITRSIIIIAVNPQTEKTRQSLLYDDAEPPHS